VATEGLVAPLEHVHTLFSTPEEIEAHVASGVMDEESAHHYSQLHDHFVEIAHRDSEGKLKSVRLSGNLRNDKGGDWQAITMGGDVAFGDTGTASASSATTLTDSGKSWTTNAWAHHIVAVGPNASGTGSTVFAPVLSNTGTVLTVDQWYTAAATIGGAAGTTPNATGKYQILGGGMPLRFIALSNDSGAPAATDTALASEITSNGLGRAEATYAHTAVSGGTSSTVSSVYTLAKTFTATGTQSAQKAAVFYSVVASTGTPMFENTFTSVSMINGDTVAVTWTITV